MTDTLITRHRPQSFDDVVGQSALVESLRETVDRNVARAYLFTGPSGCGKTTLARLVAEKVGCEARDIREIDAATYTGIDDMRTVTETLKYRPIGSSGVKALIIDECHALSKQAWQSLLKTLEEPPNWVYWFLCTTDPARVPPTIQNQRCVTYRVKPVLSDVLEELLSDICDKDGLDVSSEVISICAKMADGSPRKAITNLAKCLTARDRREAMRLLESAEESEDAVDLAKVLLQKSKWSQVTPILERLEEQDAESIRRVVRAYVSKVAIGAGNDPIRALRILDAFDKYMANEGMPAIVHACGRVLFD